MDIHVTKSSGDGGEGGTDATDDTCSSSLAAAGPDFLGTPATSSCGCPRGMQTGKGDSMPDPFREAEKRYKLYQLPRRQAKRHPVAEVEATDTVRFDNIELVSPALRQLIHRVDREGLECYTFEAVPGLLIFPKMISPEEQIAMCREAILEYGDSTQHPNILSTHAKTPRATSCYQPPMRWATLGFSYQWTSKTYHRDLYTSFPSALKERMESLIRGVATVDQAAFPCEQPEAYEPQTAIVNYFPVGATMMCHQDVSEEVLTQPLISLSLGCSAIFLMGSQSRDDAPHAFLLKSGDVAAFAGPARTAFHSTPRILDDCPAFLTVADEDLSEEEKHLHYTNWVYTKHPRPDGAFVPVVKADMNTEERERYWRLCMRHLRVNINARQVYADRCPFLFVPS